MESAEMCKTGRARSSWSELNLKVWGSSERQVPGDTVCRKRRVSFTLWGCGGNPWVYDKKGIGLDNNFSLNVIPFCWAYILDCGMKLPNFNGATVIVWEWISNYIPHFTRHVITYWCSYLNWSTLVHVNGPLIETWNLMGSSSSQDRLNSL